MQRSLSGIEEMPLPEFSRESSAGSLGSAPTTTGPGPDPEADEEGAPAAAEIYLHSSEDDALRLRKGVREANVLLPPRRYRFIGVIDDVTIREEHKTPIGKSDEDSPVIGGTVFLLHDAIVIAGSREDIYSSPSGWVPGLVDTDRLQHRFRAGAESAVNPKGDDDDDDDADALDREYPETSPNKRQNLAAGASLRREVTRRSETRAKPSSLQSRVRGARISASSTFGDAARATAAKASGRGTGDAGDENSDENSDENDDHDNCGGKDEDEEVRVMDRDNDEDDELDDEAPLQLIYMLKLAQLKLKPSFEEGASYVRFRYALRTRVRSKASGRMRVSTHILSVQLGFPSPEHCVEFRRQVTLCRVKSAVATERAAQRTAREKSPGPSNPAAKPRKWNREKLHNRPGGAVGPGAASRTQNPLYAAQQPLLPPRSNPSTARRASLMRITQALPRAGQVASASRQRRDSMAMRRLSQLFRSQTST